MSEPTTRFLVGRREGGKRLDHFLHERIPGLSRNRIQRAVRERVTLSWGARPRPATPVIPGGTVEIGHTPVHEELLALHLPVLFRGAGWLAVDKPPGIPVHPVNRIRENSLIRMLRRQEADADLRLVHRLDRETTGVLLVARGAATAAALSREFRSARVQKEYLAVVAGEVAAERGRIDLPIGDAEGSRVFVRRAAGCGQPARTDWQVERRVHGRTLLRVFPRTGRRHQIRVHLAAVGHPVLGDLLYGRPDDDYLAVVRGLGDVRLAEGGPLRQLLHCARLVCRVPGAADPVDLVAPVPADLEAALGEAR